MKYLLVAGGLAAILASLAVALVFMMRDGRNGARKTSRMAWALALRVGLSVTLFLCVLAAWKLGYIRPTGIVPGQ
jgi:F0F1-type ATP synthase assembly protein I